MNRRAFLVSGLGASLGALAMSKPPKLGPTFEDEAIRAAFPRLKGQTYLNAAGMMPLSTFSQDGLQRFMEFQQSGPEAGRGEYFREVQTKIRGLFAKLIGAQEAEVGLVHCTKAGEQIVLDSLDAIREGGNIVTNDLHFTGSLHNYVGLQRAGQDVRIVRAKDWTVRFEEMQAVIDDRTALVAVSLVSNINGHVEDLAALSNLAHEHGALVYADIIQAAGIMPIDVHELGVDVAACSCYKWLYGVHGTGFLFVREEVQGGRLRDRLFPGHVRHNYSPWVEMPDSAHSDFLFESRVDATRYQPGHVSYLGYCAAYEGLKFLRRIGLEAALAHSIHLNRRLEEQIDHDRFVCISPHLDRSPIITFTAKEPDTTRERLAKANVVVSISGNRIRVSPALYNTEGDVDLLIEAMNG